MLAVHDFLSYTPEIYLRTSDRVEIKSDSEYLKIVGFYFDSRPDASLHVKMTISKTRRRF